MRSCLRGSYTIHVSSVDPETRECTATVKRLNLTRDVSGLQLALAPCATITVNVHVEQTKPDTNKTPSMLDENGVCSVGREISRCKSRCDLTMNAECRRHITAMPDEG